MCSIDWSLAPEGATHAILEAGGPEFLRQGHEACVWWMNEWRTMGPWVGVHFLTKKTIKRPAPQNDESQNVARLEPVMAELSALREAYVSAGEREHALRVELADEHRKFMSERMMADCWQSRGAAAEQRNARYESLLRQIIPCLAMSTNTTAPTYIRQITEALPQPTESGASE